MSGVAWNGSLWVAVGAGPGGFAVATSPDGQAWTARAAPAAGSGLAVAWNGSEWLVGGHALGGMLASPDGITWTLRPTSFGAGDVRAVAWNGAAWLATAGSSLATSSDGVVWTTQPSPVVSPRALAWNGFTWAVGGQQAVALGSGTSWTVSTLMTAEVYGLAWAGGQWAAIGEGPTGAMAMYFNGINWTTGGVPFQTRGRAIAYRKPLYPPPPP